MIVTTDRPDCSLCGELGETRYPDVRDRLFDAPASWSVLDCPRCGLVWLNPQPQPDEVGKLYESYFTHEDTEADSAFKRAVKRGVPAELYGYDDVVGDARERRRGRLLARVGPLREVAEQSILHLPASRRGRLLDVGCGAGTFLAHMRSLGWEVCGAEPDPEARKLARDAASAEIYADVIDEPALRDDSFDAVTLNHVIEHLPDPAATLRACRRVLSPSGWLVIATPNARSLGHRRFGRDWIHLDAPRHLHLYDPCTLALLVESSGFRVHSATTPCATAHFVWLASSLLRRRGSLPGIDTHGAPVWTTLAGFAFWAWEYGQTRLGRPCGEEVLVIAEKRPTYAELAEAGT